MEFSKIIKLSNLNDKDWSKILKDHQKECAFNMKVRHKNLRLAKEVLESCNSKYWIIGGLLLGFYRDNDFIPWDWDIDIDMFSENMRDSYDDLAQRFMDVGFIVRRNHQFPDIKINLFRKKDRITIRGLFKDESGRYLMSKVDRYPIEFFQKTDYIEFQGNRYPAPHPIKKYILYLYGKNWKKPIKDRKKLRADYYNRGVMRESYAKDIMHKM